MENNTNGFLKHLRFMYVLLMILIIPAIANATPIYNYTITGHYSYQSSTGEDWIQGNLLGSALISDTFNEITDPNFAYDEWDVLSWEFMAEGYQFEGLNGVIERHYQNSYMTLDGAFFGYSEFTQIIFTGPNATPLQHMYFGGSNLHNFDDGSAIVLSSITLDQVSVSVPEPSSLVLLAIGLGFTGFAGCYSKRRKLNI